MRVSPGALLLVPISLVLILATCAQAQTYEEASRYYQRRSLEGVKSFEVGLFPFPETPGLPLKDIDQSTRARLKRQGLPVLPLTLRPQNSLAIHLTLRYDAARKVYAVGVRLELMQMGHVDRTDDARAVTTWWRDDVVITDASFGEVRTTLAEMLDEFASEWKIANP